MCARARLVFSPCCLRAIALISFVLPNPSFLARHPMPAPTQTAPTRAATRTPHAAAKHTPPAPLGAPERPSPLATRAPLFPPYNIPLPSPLPFPLLPRTSTNHQIIPRQPIAPQPACRPSSTASPPPIRLPRRPVRRLAQPAVGPLSPTHHIVTLEHTARRRPLHERCHQPTDQRLKNTAPAAGRYSRASATRSPATLAQSPRFLGVLESALS